MNIVDFAVSHKFLGLSADSQNLKCVQGLNLSICNRKGFCMTQASNKISAEKITLWSYISYTDWSAQTLAFHLPQPLSSKHVFEIQEWI